MNHYFKHFIVDGTCVSSNHETSTFRSDALNENVKIINSSIRRGVLDSNSYSQKGGVKVGVTARILILEYPNGTRVAYLSDPMLEHKKEATQNCGPNYGTESGLHENKKSLRVACKKDLDPLLEDSPSQFRVLATELSAMSNARLGDFELTIGVDDEGNPVGINHEVINTVDAESELRNYFSQVLGVTFTASLTFLWETPETQNGKLLVLRIQGKQYNGSTPILVAGTYCYVRSGSNSQRLSGIDLINFIKNF